LADKPVKQSILQRRKRATNGSPSTLAAATAPANEAGLFFGHCPVQMLGLKALPAKIPLDQMLQRFGKLCFLYAECTASICVLYFVAQKAYITPTRDFRFEPRNKALEEIQ
jgi:hypothetical protein